LRLHDRESIIYKVHTSVYTCFNMPENLSTLSYVVPPYTVWNHFGTELRGLKIETQPNTVPNG
jgi:hypothetical protein